MLQPKRTKFRKFQKGRFKGISNNLQKLTFGSYGLKIKESAKISARLIETIRRSLTRTFQRKGKVWTRIFPSIAVTRKPVEFRMGKGKGNPEYWISKVQPGQILFEMDGITHEQALKAKLLAEHKMPEALVLVRIQR